MDWLGAGALGLSAAGTLFGAKSSKDSQKDALRAQQKQNEQSQKFLEMMYDKGRRDVLKYVPQGADAARRAYETAYEIARQAGHDRMGVATRGNMAAQNTLLAGLPQMNNAIRGEDVDLSGLQANNAGVYGGDAIYNAMRLTPDAIQNALAGSEQDLAEVASGGYEIEPGKTTNRSLVDQAYRAGDISGRDYKWFQEVFNTGDVGDQSNWTAFEPGRALTGEELEGLNVDNRKRMEQIIALAQKYRGAV